MSSGFNWEDVRMDKQRDHYLGCSVKAPIGFANKNKDLFWYAKERKKPTQEDLEMIKKQEKIALLEALGLPVPDELRVQKKLNNDEMKMLLSREKGTEDDGERLQGLGSAPVPQFDVVDEHLIENPKKKTSSSNTKNISKEENKQSYNTTKAYKSHSKSRSISRSPSKTQSITHKHSIHHHEHSRDLSSTRHHRHSRHHHHHSTSRDSSRHLHHH
ncbi:hypothetical protein WA158_008282 [Blastocystis sp. Blastoise]